MQGEPFTVDKEYLEQVMSELLSDQYGVPIKWRLVPKEETPNPAQHGA